MGMCDLHTEIKDYFILRYYLKYLSYIDEILLISPAVNGKRQIFHRTNMNYSLKHISLSLSYLTDHRSTMAWICS